MERNPRSLISKEHGYPGYTSSKVEGLASEYQVTFDRWIECDGKSEERKHDKRRPDTYIELGGALVQWCAAPGAGVDTLCLVLFVLASACGLGALLAQDAELGPQTCLISTDIRQGRPWIEVGMAMRNSPAGERGQLSTPLQVC